MLLIPDLVLMVLESDVDKTKLEMVPDLVGWCG